MNNLPSSCGLVDAKIRASNKNLPVKTYVQLEGLCTATNPTPPEIPKKNPVHSPVPTYAVEK